MKEIIYDIEKEFLAFKKQAKFNKVDTLHKLKEEYMIDNYNKSKDELVIINEVLNDFMDYIIGK